MFRKGFTLTELLMVIGLIVLLVGILLPAIGRARDSARKAVCASNIHQLSVACLQYVTENENWFPAASPRSPYGLHTYDWVWWRSSAVRSGDVTQSPLAKYAGGTGFAKLLVCPAETGIRKNIHAGDPPYPYSYSLNSFLTGYQFAFAQTVNIMEVIGPSTKIMFAEEDEKSLNDGGFWGVGDQLSIRHERSRISPDTFQPENAQCRGNISFCDGHVEFVSRTFSNDPLHYQPSQ